MSYSVSIVADSVGPHGKRITTMVATFPRFILAELNTHRMLSRNSASSRAIPPEIIIEKVKRDPFVPDTFSRRVKGMGFGDALSASDQAAAENAWLFARDKAVLAAQTMLDLQCDKSRINRLLEPFMWHTALITATEWDNFFALRQPNNDDPVPQKTHGAQPEFQIIARMMRDAMRDSSPRELEYGDWHLPFVDLDLMDEDGEHPALDDWYPLISAGRCFVVSYDRLAEIMDEAYRKSYDRADKGKDIGHWSPLEHPAQCDQGEFANFRGWRQLRHFYPNEDDFSKVLSR